jgi:hypothetical protein
MMRSIGRVGLVAVVLVVALAFVSSPAWAKGKKAKKPHSTAGKVTAVDQQSITIETKKQGTKKFTLTATTVYEKASKDKTKPATPATLADVKAGQKAKVVASADQAQKVTFSGGKGKGKAKQGKKHK